LQGIQCGDWFAADCVLSQSVPSLRGTRGLY
jgi:hypothetical protein